MSFGIAQNYNQVQQYSSVEDASPHKLVDMLFVAATDRIAEAKGQISRNEIQAKGTSLSKAIDIIEELRRTLDLEKGGEVAENLHDLYEYMKRRLLEANLHNNLDFLDEVSALLLKVQDGWRNIPEEYRNQPAPA